MINIITIILYFISLLIGSCALWLSGKLSPKPLPFKYFVLGAFFTEIPRYFSLLVIHLTTAVIDVLGLIIAWVVLIKMKSMKIGNAFLGAVLFMFIRTIIAIIIGFVFTTFAIKFYF